MADEEAIAKINLEIKLLQYKLALMVSSGIDHFLELKVSQINKISSNDEITSPTDLKVQKVWNCFEL